MKANIRYSVVVNLIRTITMTVLSLVTFPLVCRILGDSALGTYTWAASFIYYFIILSKISIPNIAVRECAKVKDDPVKLSMKVQEFFILQAIMSVLSFGLMVALVFLVPSFKDNSSLIFILSLNFLSSVFAFEWLFTALEKHTYLAIRSIIILALSDILIFALIKRADDLWLYAFLVTLVAILTMVSNLIYMPSLLKFKKEGKYNFKQYIPMLRVMFVISMLVAIYSKTDSFILGFIDESKASVGTYSVGMKGVDIVIGLIIALSAVFMPRASYLYANDELKEYKKLNIFSSNLCFVIVVPAIALMVAMASPITKLISGVIGYYDADLVLIALAALMLTYSLSNIIYTQILIPQKREKIYLIAMAIGCALNIGLSLLFGMVIFKDSPAFGVAIATTITDAVVLVTLLGFTWSDSKSMLFNFDNLKILILGGALWAFAFFVGPLIQKALDPKIGTEMAMLSEIGIIFISSTIIYLIGLILLKEKIVRTMFRSDDRE